MLLQSPVKHFFFSWISLPQITLKYCDIILRLYRPYSEHISINTKMRIFNSNVKQVMLYGSETWTNRLQTFSNACLRRILNIWRRDEVNNVDLWKRTSQDPTDLQIRRRKQSWIGHALRKPATNITRQAPKWNPQGTRTRGRPRNSWRSGRNVWEWAQQWEISREPPTTEWGDICQWPMFPWGAKGSSQAEISPCSLKQKKRRAHCCTGIMKN